MHLILSSHNPRDSVYSTGAGQILYKADRSRSSITSLSKAVGRNTFALYAQIEFHTFKSTCFRFGDIIVPVDEFFHKEGWLNPRWVFRAANGKEYYWMKLDGKYLEMFSKDGSKQQVVRFREHKRSFIPFTTHKFPSLEVDNSCSPILDEIITTFVYCQNQRKKRSGGSSDVAGASGSV